MTTINIAMVADWAYAMPLETTIKSIFYHNEHVKLYILNHDIPQEWFKFLNQEAQALDIKIIDCKYNDSQLKGQTVSQKHVDVTSSARILIPQLVPESRVIYLDADLIVCKPLLKLFTMDMKDYFVGAVTDFGDPHDFNAGVMVLDLDQLREIDNLTNKMLEFGARPNLPNGDQSVLNHFFGNERYELPAKYNLQMNQEQKLANWVQYNIPEAKERYDYVHRIMQDLSKEVIVHYLGSAKPWKISSICRQRELWWQYHDLDWDEIVRHEPLPIMTSSKGPQIFIYTLSDALSNLDAIIEAFPNVTFNIGTSGMFNDHFNRYIAYPNVNLFAALLDDEKQELIKNSSLYLDIDGGAGSHKDLSIPRAIMDRGRQVFAFDWTKSEQLMGNPNYHVLENDDVNSLVQQIYKIIH